MQLPDSLLKEFAHTTNDETPKTSERVLYGQVVVSNDIPYVVLDGSSVLTPIVTTVEVHQGDRVTVIIKDHSAIITGNLSVPAITRAGETYTRLTEDGVIVGQFDEHDEPTGLYTLTKPTGYAIYDADGNLLNEIDDDSFDIYADIPTNPRDSAVPYTTRKKVASFGKKTVIGSEDRSHFVFENYGMFVYDISGNKYIDLSELGADSAGLIVCREVFHGHSTGPATIYPYVYTVNHNVASNYEPIVKIDDVLTTAYTRSGRSFIFDTEPLTSSIIEIVYGTNDTITAYTFGTRASGIAKGEHSLCIGSNNAASGRHSVAVGDDNVSQGYGAVTYGKGLIANRKNQVVLGQYNKTQTGPDWDDGNEGSVTNEQEDVTGEDGLPSYYQIVLGNGLDEDRRSNALVGDWDGNIQAAGQLYSTPKALTLSRINNSYVDATSFARLTAYLIGNLIVIRFNLQLTTAMPQSSDWVAIGNVITANPDLTGLLQTAMVTVPSTGNGAVVSINITTNGTIQLFNNSSAAATGLLRASITLVCAKKYNLGGS